MARGRDKTIGRYLLREVAAHAPAHSARFARGPGGEVPRTVDELTRVPAASLQSFPDPAALVLRPSAPKGKSGRAHEAWREMLRRYKPVHWVVQDGIPLGSSSADLDRLAGIGARWLAGSGVRPDDVMLAFLPAGPNLPYWELVLGARELGVSTFHVPPVPRFADAARLLPTVVVGRPADLARLLDADANAEADPRYDWRARVRVVIAAGEPLDDGLRARLLAAISAPRAAVVSAWAPAGVRALWWECRGNPDLHTWPDTEIIQIIDPLSGTPVPPGADGEVVWTALGWYGSVLVRLRTGVFAALEMTPCPACGRPGPRLAISAAEPSFLRILDRHPGVAGWQAELRVVDGNEELVVFLTPAPDAPLAQLLAELDKHLGATQYVVLDPDALDARLADHDDQRVVDTRRISPR